VNYVDSDNLLYTPIEDANDVNSSRFLTLYQGGATDALNKDLVNKNEGGFKND
jgi:hypothetical protein